jgi:zona occludens toxin
MGTGKSYEVVSSVVVQAVAAGRRVVSNIAGLNSEAVRDYVACKFQLEDEKLGCVVNVTDDQVRALDFFPDRAAAESGECNSIVRPGDLVAIDEAYKIWGKDEKIHRRHMIFFREHRHYTHPETGVSCDLVIMTQDIGDLHRSIKAVIGNSFKTHKAKGIGFDNLYTITMWEGWKQPAKHIVKDWTKTYDPEIFPLYKSYAGAKQGKELNSDARMNIFSDRRSMFKIVFFVLVVVFICWRLFHWWWGKTHPDAPAKPASSASVPATVPGKAPDGSPRPVSAGNFSSDFRIVGNLVADGVPFVILSGVGGIRIEPAKGFTGAGFGQAGTVDGHVVTRFSGAPVAAPSEVRK